MNRLGVLFVSVGAVLFAGRVAGGEEPAKGTCRIAGETRLDGKPVAAVVEVRLRAPNPPFPHGYWWTGEAVLHRLAERRLDGPPDAVVRSGDDGAFDARGLAPGRYWVLARLDSGAWGAVHVALHVAGQHERASIELRAGTERVAGRLLHEDGRPWRGFVAASRRRLTDPEAEDVLDASERWAATDAEGRFAIEGLARGNVRLSALDPGRMLRPIGEFRLPLEDEVEAVPDGVEHPVVGCVRDIETDAPVAGASVIWVQYTELGTWCGVETTAEDGMYSIPFPRGVDNLHVRKRGYAERYVDRLGGVGRETVRLRRGVRVTGRVRTPDGGSPGAGLLVERHGPGSYWYQWTRATTDAEGRFALDDQPPGSGPIWARGDGWVPRGLRARELFDEFHEIPRLDPFVWTVEPRGEIDVPLAVERAARIEGRVVDADGRGVPGVALVMEHGADPAFSWTGHTLPPIAASGEDGRFRIDGLLAGGEYEVSARPADGAPVEAKWVAVGAGEEARPFVLTIPRAHWIRVRVVDRRTKAPIPGATVEISVDNRRDDRSWFTDAVGVAKVGPLGPFPGDVYVDADGYIDANQRPVPAATPEGAEATVEMDPALSITGRVVWEDGRPAAGATVYVAEMSQDIWKTYRGKKECDADGRFVAERVQDVDYRLGAVLWRGKERFAATAVAHGGAVDVLLTLAPEPKPVPDPAPEIGPAEERPAVARLKVVDPDGRPVPRASVSGSREGVVDGVAVFDSAPSDGVPIEIGDARADDGLPLPLGPLRLAGWPKGAGEIPTVVLPRERAIEGRVVAPDGSPVPRASLRAVAGEALPWEAGSPHGSVEGTGVSRPDGTFRIGRLEDREYGVEGLYPAGFLPPAAPIRARPGVSVEIRVRRALDATVTVTDPEGRPVVGARVAVSQASWSYFWRYGWERRPLSAATATTDAKGRAVLENLDPDRSYGLSIEPPKDRTDVSSDERQRWKPKDETIALGPRGVVKGEVLGAEAREAWSADVYWRQGGAWRRATHPRSGTFEAVLPVRGEVELFAGPPGMRAALPTTRVTKAKTGDEGVVVHFDPGASLTVRTRGLAAGPNEAVQWQVVEEGEGIERTRGYMERTPLEGGAAQETFEGLDPAARYTLVAIYPPGRLCARIPGLAPGKDPVDVTFVPGGAIEGTARGEGPLPASTDSGPVVTVRPVGGGPAVIMQTAGENFRIEGLPPGRWTVTFRGVVGDDDVEASGEVETGGRLDLVLLRR